MTDRLELRARVAARWPAPGDGWTGAALDARDDLLHRWAEPHRRYHSLAHLDAVLDRLDQIAAAGDAVTSSVRLAAWFHDAIYDPRRPDNEGASAALARSSLRGVVVEAVMLDVERLILVTAGHRPTAPDEQALVDADLAVLGGAPQEYDAYVAGVRAEYAFVDDAAWRHGRAAVLRSLLDADRLFHTRALTHLEAPARANLGRELRSLEGVVHRDAPDSPR